jgi:SAM-dependent methyltransferase
VTFQDHFSAHADDYARFRPRYPDALFGWLSEFPTARRSAWDVGAGNGQAAFALLPYFDRVVATDPSPQQIALTPPHDRLVTMVAAETCASIADGSVDLITVAQAAHWFDLESFYGEVRRVASPGAVVALWCYGLFRVAPTVDAIVDRFCVDEVGADWPPERRQVDEAYRNLAFPFDEIDAPVFAIECRLSLEGLMAYVRTWSAVQRYAKRTGRDPLTRLRMALSEAVVEGEILDLRFPLGLRVGRVGR